MRIRDLGEFRFIERLARLSTRGEGVELAIGDDAAVVRPRTKRLVLTTDALIEGTHFQLGWDRPHGLGQRAFAVNASDVAAMGGLPRYALVSIAVPPTTDVRVLESFHRGFAFAANAAGCSLVGGNLASSRRWMVSIALVGELEGPPLRRAGARPGDEVWVSGRLGGAALGREALLRKRRSAPPAAVRAFRRPKPPLGLGPELAARGLATAAIDLSDGLLQDLGHLCRASGVGAEVEEGRLPFGPGLRKMRRAEALRLALSGGEDYELLFTAAPRSAPEIGRLTRNLRAVSVTRIGVVREDAGIRLADPNGRLRPVEPRGFRHF